MEKSVAVYEQLGKLTDGTYRWANDLCPTKLWSTRGLAEFRKDLEDQKTWITGFKTEASAVTVSK